MADTPVYWVTPRLGVGPFISPPRALALKLAGVTDILNVSDSRTFPETLAAGFRSVVWVPIADFVPIIEEDVISILTALDTMFLAPSPVVFVHCLAGYNRSPTAIWLYLRSLGVNAEVAQQMIEQASPKSVGGHPLLVSAETTNATIAHRLSRSSETTEELRRVVLD
jgi:protein-tyrosine phosphatase